MRLPRRCRRCPRLCSRSPPIFRGRYANSNNKVAVARPPATPHRRPTNPEPLPNLKPCLILQEPRRQTHAPKDILDQLEPQGIHTATWKCGMLGSQPQTMLSQEKYGVIDYVSRSGGQSTASVQSVKTGDLLVRLGRFGFARNHCPKF
jgi:hypothetical protein